MDHTWKFLKKFLGNKCAGGDWSELEKEAGVLWEKCLWGEEHEF